MAFLGVVSALGGAAAVEFRRLRGKGGPEEVKSLKKKERELQAALHATTQELERAKQAGAAAEERASELAAKAQSLEANVQSLSSAKAELQGNNNKLLLTNLLLMNKAKALEEHTRTLVAKQEDLQHQLEQAQRDRSAAEASFEESLGSIKERLTGVLARYFSKDIDLQQALSEMAGMGIDVVSMEEHIRQGMDGSRDFETKLVLDSPHRMQRLACAGSSIRMPQLTAGGDGAELPMLSFPMGISRDPTTGAPRITLGWRTEPQFGSPARPGSLGGVADAPAQLQDQAAAAAAAAPGAGKQPALLRDTSSPDKAAKAAAVAAKAASAAAGKGPVVEDARGGAALTFTSPQKPKPAGQKQGAGFSLGFGGLFGGSSSGGGGGAGSSSSAGAKAAAAGAAMLKDFGDDSADVFGSGRELSRR